LRLRLRFERGSRTDAEDDSGTQTGDAGTRGGCGTSRRDGGGADGAGTAGTADGQRAGAGYDATGTEGVSARAVASAAVSTADGTDGASDDAAGDVTTTRRRWSGGDGGDAAGARARSGAAGVASAPTDAKRGGAESRRIDVENRPVADSSTAIRKS